MFSPQKLTEPEPTAVKAWPGQPPSTWKGLTPLCCPGPPPYPARHAHTGLHAAKPAAVRTRPATPASREERLAVLPPTM